jgi:hypothetical protein
MFLSIICFPFGQLLEQPNRMNVITLCRSEPMVNSRRKDDEVSFRNMTSDPTFLFVSNLFVSTSKARTHVFVSLSIDNVTDFFVDVEMLLVETLNHRRIFVA